MEEAPIMEKLLLGVDVETLQQAWETDMAETVVRRGRRRAQREQQQQEEEQQVAEEEEQEAETEEEIDQLAEEKEVIDLLVEEEEKEGVKGTLEGKDKKKAVSLRRSARVEVNAPSDHYQEHNKSDRWNPIMLLLRIPTDKSIIFR